MERHDERDVFLYAVGLFSDPDHGRGCVETRYGLREKAAKHMLRQIKNPREVLIHIKGAYRGGN